VLRSNVKIGAQKICAAYIQLTEAEAAFHFTSPTSGSRPVRHQKEDESTSCHILVCSWPTCSEDSGRLTAAKRARGDDRGQVRSGFGDCVNRNGDVVLPTRSRANRSAKRLQSASPPSISKSCSSGSDSKRCPGAWSERQCSGNSPHAALKSRLLFFDRRLWASLPWD